MYETAMLTEPFLIVDEEIHPDVAVGRSHDFNNLLLERIADPCMCEAGSQIKKSLTAVFCCIELAVKVTEVDKVLTSTVKRRQQKDIRRLS